MKKQTEIKNILAGKVRVVSNKRASSLFFIDFMEILENVI